MEAKHTLGPWGISSESPTIVKAFDEFGETRIIVGSASGYKDSPCFPSDATAAANAQLMAAAPQLLCALQSIVKSLADHDDEGMIEHADQMTAARAAIAKATGSAA